MTATVFQPTLPARGATKLTAYQRPWWEISTHAPRTGSDGVRWAESSRRKDFNPRSPHGERLLSSYNILWQLSFQPTLPARGATLNQLVADNGTEISTHAPRTGSDTISDAPRGGGSIFQPTLPARGATRAAAVRAWNNDISTHAPRTGSDTRRRGADGVLGDISTHAPRTGSDSLAIFSSILTGYFNPRSPHGERPSPPRLLPRLQHFNPRSPHGERHLAVLAHQPDVVISTHAPRTGSDGCCERKQNKHPCISTHAPRTGSDSRCKPVSAESCISTHAPRTGSDGDWYDAWDSGAISTHAPRTGSDTSKHRKSSLTSYFNPRSPHGERRTLPRVVKRRGRNFNPRSPHGERRCGYMMRLRKLNNFNPRSPHGERPPPKHGSTRIPGISTHAPRTGSDSNTKKKRMRFGYFNPRSPHGERL